MLSCKFSKLYDSVDVLKNEAVGMQIDLDTIKKDNDKLKRENKDLVEKLSQMSQENKSNQYLINDLEQYSRRNSIRIYGLDDRNKQEDSAQTTEMLVKWFNDKLEVKISEGDIDISHRMGKFTEDGNRPIICKFVSRLLKTEVIRARRKLKGSSMVIREDLTYQNVKLLQKTVEKENVKSAWSDDGRIIALLQSGRKVPVDLRSDLNAL